MIGALQGKIFTVARNPLVLMVAGVGYSVFVPNKLISKLTRDTNITLFIHTHVRDDALDLFGFPTLEELDLFNLLLGVSGVGPKTALAVIDQGVDEVISAVSVSDVEFFTSIPRLGKKNAQKIIIELKGKLGSIRELDLTGETENETREILEALTGFGFEKSEALSVLKKISRKAPLEQRLREALKYLAKK